MYYTIGCPAAGCDPWDRLGWVKVYNVNVKIKSVKILCIILFMMYLLFVGMDVVKLKITSLSYNLSC